MPVRVAEQVALGWVARGTSLPPTLRACGQGPVHVIAASSDRCTTAHQRLTLLQHSFDHGVDLLPLRCDQAWPVAQALDLADTCAADILAQLAAIKGAGQLSITLSWSKPSGQSADCTSGRAWLAARHLAHHKRADQIQTAQRVMTALTGALPAFRRSSGTDVSHRLDLLLPRHQLSAAKAHLAAAALELTEPDLPGLALTVTGLWPAYAFVTAPLALVPT